MTPIIGDIPFMNDALASIGVQGYTQVLFVVELSHVSHEKAAKGKGKEREGEEGKKNEGKKLCVDPPRIITDFI